MTTTHHQSEKTMTDPEKRLVVDQEEGEEGDKDAKEVASWLFPQTSYGGDRVVPLKLEESRGHQCHNQQNFQFNIKYGSSGTHYNDNGSINHNVRLLYICYPFNLASSHNAAG
jgi:zinc finger protein CONSTANS